LPVLHFCDIIYAVMKMEEKFSERKPTRVKRYDYSKAGAYFVTICVQDRKPILSEIIRTNNPSVNETNNTAVGGDVLCQEQDCKQLCKMIVYSFALV